MPDPVGEATQLGERRMPPNGKGRMFKMTRACVSIAVDANHRSGSCLPSSLNVWSFGKHFFSELIFLITNFGCNRSGLARMVERARRLWSIHLGERGACSGLCSPRRSLEGLTYLH